MQWTELKIITYNTEKTVKIDTVLYSIDLML